MDTHVSAGCRTSTSCSSSINFGCTGTNDAVPAAAGTGCGGGGTVALHRCAPVRHDPATCGSAVRRAWSYRSSRAVAFHRRQLPPRRIRSVVFRRSNTTASFSFGYVTRVAS
ncbi:hypothetical protein STCU_11352 [Strigomonas culicis]|uniref:Uncharacterized protein n=1 Tax=Strigomonas culicis TaxID=28005 RepID=S9TJ09_9TRYP|nr:hypothetical protein STCU_11352 [Strigomonas culicis]|eukprot:EPY16368.1 hypothetical protein STCU_11352 [Strigomonas culicis]